MAAPGGGPCGATDAATSTGLRTPPVDGGARPGDPPPAGPTAPDGAVGRVEVVLRNGRVLRVGTGADIAAVARLAAALDR